MYLLSNCCHQEKKFTVDRARFYCAQISLAFLFLHGNGIGKLSPP